MNSTTKEIKIIRSRNPRNRQLNTKRSTKARISLNRFGADSPRAVKLHYQASTIVSQVTASFGAYDFQLDQFEGYADWSAVMDAYRLLKVKVRILPRVNVQSLTTQAVAATGGIPFVLLAVDYDDATVPSSLSEVLQYTDVKVCKLFEETSITFRPKISKAVYQSGGFTGYAQDDANTWIDCASNDVEHYGLKYGVSSTGASQTTFPQYYVFVTGWFEFRQPR